MRLKSMERLAATVSRPSGLAILMTSGGDHRRIDQRAGFDLYGLCLELVRDFIEELLIHAVSQQLLINHQHQRCSCQLSPRGRLRYVDRLRLAQRPTLNYQSTWAARWGPPRCGVAWLTLWET